MSKIITYVCDCCGFQSVNQTNFNTTTPAPYIGDWTSCIQGALLCNTCCNAVGTAGSAALAARQGINKGITMPGG